MIWKNRPSINVPTQYYIALDTEYSQMKDIPVKAAGFFYVVFYNKVIEILDVVFASDLVIPNIPFELNEEYVKLTWLLRLIKSRKDMELPNTEIRAFASLHDDYKDRIDHWNIMRNLFLDDLAILTKRYGDPLPPYKYPLPLDIEKCFGLIDKALKHYLADKVEH